MPVESKRLQFAAEDRSVEELAGINIPPSATFDIFKKTFSNNNGQFRSAAVNADYFYNLTTGLELELARPTLGEVDIDYPVDVELDLPDAVTAGQEFSVGTTNNYVVSNASVTGQSLNFGKAGLNLTFESGGAGITNLEFGNLFGRSLIQLDQNLLFDGFAKTGIELASITPGAGIDVEVIDGVDLSASLPAGEENTSPLTSGGMGQLVSVGVDVNEPLLNISANPFELLDDFGPLRALDVLTEDFGPVEFSFIGDTYEAGFSYTLVAPSIAGGYGLVQNFSFDPDNIFTTIDIGDQSFSGNIGESFDFTAPEDLTDPLNGTISYMLDGSVDVSYALAPIGSLGIEILSAQGSIGEKGQGTTDIDIGPLFSDSISGSTDFGKIELFDPISFELPDDFFAPIVQEFEIPLGENTLGFVNDFVTGTTQDTQIVFDLERMGDTSSPVRIFVDGEVTNGSEAFFTDFFFTVPSGENPTLPISASVSEVDGDVAFSLDISIDENDPSFDLIKITDSTANGLLIGDQVDDRGGRTFGDPHFITFDNVAYDFQAAGDFVLARATDGDDYEVQVRFVSLSSAVSATSAMATRVDGTTVSLEVNGNEGRLLIGGNERTLENGQSLTIGDGRISRTGRAYNIDYGNGDQTSVSVFSTFMNVTPLPSLARTRGAIEGLLGDGNGNPSNDFQLADGTVLETPIPSEVLYGEYAAGWLTKPSESILPGEREAFAAPGRILTIDSLPTSLREAAEARVDAAGITNPLIREAAIFDFAL
ncbi:MAG: VWD domain-containing protein, partial [Bacteroidota bacterium]